MGVDVRSWGLKLVSALAPPLFLLGGCGVQPLPGVSAEQAQLQFFSALDSTQELVGGVWENQDDPIARGCVLPVWSEGISFPALRTSDGPRDPDAIASSVVDAWSGWGYDVERVDIGSVIQLLGTTPQHEVIIFRVNERAMTLQGESECRPA